MAAVLSAEIINASDCKRSRSISLGMYLSLAVEGNDLVCVWPLLNDELLRPTGEKVSHRPCVCLIYRASVSFATLAGEKQMQAKAAFCFGGVRVSLWSVGQDAVHHIDSDCFSTYKGKYRITES